MAATASASQQPEGAAMEDEPRDGNRSQVRVILNQLLDEQEVRKSSARNRFSASIPAWIACAMSLATLIWGAGTLSGQVNRNTNDIRELKTAQVLRDTGDQQVRDRLARIETKVDLVVEEVKR